MTTAVITFVREYNTSLFHGPVVAVGGVGYLFNVKSGAGKSTHTRFWCKYLGEQTVIVNDATVTVFGTPYNGKHRIGSNIAVPLKAICFFVGQRKTLSGR